MIYIYTWYPSLNGRISAVNSTILFWPSCYNWWSHESLFFVGKNMSCLSELSYSGWQLSHFAEWEKFRNAPNKIYNVPVLMSVWILAFTNSVYVKNLPKLQEFVSQKFSFPSLLLKTSNPFVKEGTKPTKGPKSIEDHRISDGMRM